jgi:hypothetical protein
MRHRRVFFLFKGETLAPPDSRQRVGLTADFKVEAVSTSLKVGQPLVLNVVATNNGSAVWRPSNARYGAVRFGIHLFDVEGRLIDLDYFRQSLPGEGREIMPSESVQFVAEVPMPVTGKHVLQCDLVSEGVCWFEHNGSHTVKLTVEVS